MCATTTIRNELYFAISETKSISSSSINKLLFNWKKFEEKERTIAKANNSSLKESFNYLHHCILLGLS